MFETVIETACIALLQHLKLFKTVYNNIDFWTFYYGTYIFVQI